MIILKMEQDKSLVVTHKTPLYQFEHKSDSVVFLLPPAIDDIVVQNAYAVARFILPDGTPLTRALARKDELYKDYAQYVTAFTSVMTAAPGEVEIVLSIVDAEGRSVMRSSPAFRQILPSLRADDLLQEGQLDQLDWLTMLLARTETKLDREKADSIFWDADGDFLQLSSHDVPIGDRVYAKDIFEADDNQVLEFGPMPDTPASPAEPDDSVIEFGGAGSDDTGDDDSIIEFGGEEISKEPADGVIEF